MPVNGVLPVYIFVPLEPETNPVSVNVTASNVVLSLVALILKSERPSGNSANKTIRAVLGTLFAVKVSDIIVILVLLTNSSVSAITNIPLPPKPPLWSAYEPPGPPAKEPPPPPVFAKPSSPLDAAAGEVVGPGE